MRSTLLRLRRDSMRLQRAAYWLLLAVLTLQLVGMTLHHHDLADDDHDCVSCYLSAHMPTTMSSITIAVAVTLLVLRYRVHTLPIYRFVAEQSYLIPLALAPPSVLIPA